jgi:hypothetical protein
MRTIRILLLEDDLETVSKLVERFGDIEKIFKVDLSVMVLSEYTQAEYLNTSQMKFDIILLDRDCKACGSFHILDLNKFGIDKVISISSTPRWNKEAQERGVNMVIWKDYEHLDRFIDAVTVQVMQMITAQIPPDHLDEQTHLDSLFDFELTSRKLTKKDTQQKVSNVR